MFNCEKHPVDQIRLTMKHIYDMSLTTSSGGNLSMLDGDGYVWMSPTTLDKGALKREEISRYTIDNELLSGKPGSGEWKINIAIHRVRPDIKAVVHMHSPGVLCYALARKLPDFKLIADAALVEDKAAQVPFLSPGSDELCEAVCNAFKSGADILFLDSHGVFIGSTVDMFDAFRKFELVTTLSVINAIGSGLGTPKALSEEDVKAHQAKKDSFAMPEYAPYTYPREEVDIRDEVVAIAKRGYNYRLLTTAQGNVSARVGEKAFVVTPDNCDFTSLCAVDLIRIEDGKVEQGKKAPMRADYLQAIYETKPEIAAITISPVSELMAFAVSDTPFELGIDPELYNMVRGIKYYDYGTDPKEIAEGMSLKCTTALIKNDCAIVGCDTVYKSLGRAEVANNIAKSLLYMRPAGLEPVQLTQAQIDRMRNW